MRQQLDSLLQQKMTRKEFLQYAGSGLLVLFGVSSLLKAFNPAAQNKSVNGYGVSAYGGSTNSLQKLGR